MTENKLNQMLNCGCADKSSAPPEGLAFCPWLIQHTGVPLLLIFWGLGNISACCHGHTVFQMAGLIEPT